MTNIKNSNEQMFIYHQIILEKVSFSPELFYRELHKAVDSLPAEQAHSLLIWARMRFGYQNLPCTTLCSHH